MESNSGLHNWKQKWLSCQCCLLVSLLILLVFNLILLLGIIVQLHPRGCKELEMSTKLVSTFDYEKYFTQHSDPDLVKYIQRGVTTEHTLQTNQAAFVRYKILPRSLVDVTNASDTSTTILGKRVAMPIGTSPTAWQRWVHSQGDNATARAAEQCGTIFILSCFSNLRLEEVAMAAPNTRKWMQIYLFDNHDVILNFVHRAETAGYEAIVVTIDHPVKTLHYSYMRGEFTFPDLPFPNFSNWSESRRLTNSWEVLNWLQAQTILPIILKGLQNPDDVKQAVVAGVQGIIVSNHGGRVLDGMPATIDVLSAVVAASSGRLEIYLDSGVRTGMDVFKALALGTPGGGGVTYVIGARMVFVGRPMIWGLAHSGQEGVEDVMHLLNKELSNTMAMTGAPGIKYIKPSMVIIPGSSLNKQ